MNTLGYMIDRVNATAGFADPTLNASQRALLVEYINEAAAEVYTREDLPISLQECYVRATANRELALPPFIGEIRAIRPGCTDYCTPKWKLVDLMPKYVRTQWETNWRNWRIKGQVPIAIEWLNTAPGTLVYPAVDADLQVTIVGSTENSNRTIDTVTMSAANPSWTNTFININRIFKNKVTPYDVVIKDADDNEAAIIYADALESRYLLVDVSQYPEMECCGCDDGTFIMEVLYKPRLMRLEEDMDSFPVDGFEDVIVLIAKRLIAEDRPGEEQRALLMEQKAQKRIDQISKDKIGTAQRRLTFARNPFYGLFRR